MWFRVDDKLWGSPKWLGIKSGARALWVTAGAWSMDQLTDGHVPAHVVPILGGRPSDAKALVTCGLWETTDDGYQFHDWHDWQPTRESIITKRESEAQRKAEWRAKRSQKRQESTENPPMSQRDNDGTTASVPPVSHDSHTVSPAPVPNLSRSSRPDPTRPDPTQPKKKTPSSSAAAGAAFDEFWAIYPRKEDKGRARPAWDKAIKKADPARIIEGAKRYAANPDLYREGGKYIKLPATWLNAEAWDNQPTNVKQFRPQSVSDRLPIVGGGR